jgi:hypothetical protein
MLRWLLFCIEEGKHAEGRRYLMNAAPPAFGVLPARF